MHMHLPMYVSVATEADIPALCGLLGELFAQESEFTPDAEAQRRGIARVLADPDAGTVLVAVEDEKVVGMVSLLYTTSTALGAPVALLEDMVVTPAARGRGIGTMLLQGAYQAARMHGCRRITLLTDADNAAAQRFYARHGFQRSPMVPLRIALN